MHRTNLRWLQIVVTLSFAFAALPLKADGSKDSLKGIKEVFVGVLAEAHTDTDGMLSPIQTDVELRLRKAGVAVSDGSSVPQAYLFVLISSVKKAGIYAYNCRVELKQDVVTRSNRFSMLAPTWSDSSNGMVGRDNMVKEIRDVVGDLVDKFLNDFLSVNPK